MRPIILSSNPLGKSVLVNVYGFTNLNFYNTVMLPKWNHNWSFTRIENLLQYLWTKSSYHTVSLPLVPVLSLYYITRLIKCILGYPFLEAFFSSPSPPRSKRGSPKNNPHLKKVQEFGSIQQLVLLQYNNLIMKLFLCQW